MRIEDVKQWNCGNGKAVAVKEKRYLGTFVESLLSQWEPVTDLEGIFNSEQVKEIVEMKARGSSNWTPFKYKIENIASDGTYTLNGWVYNTRRRLVLNTALCNTDSSPEVVVSKIESPAQITIGDTSFTKLTDGFIQILTKNGCVELVPEEIEELYKFIK